MLLKDSFSGTLHCCHNPFFLHLFDVLFLQVIDHYENPRNVGSLDKSKISVGTGVVGAPACGDVMKLQIEVDENGVIREAKFKTFGCGSAIASSSYVTELIKGMSLTEASSIKNTQIAKELSLPPVKLHCSSMCFFSYSSAFLFSFLFLFFFFSFFFFASSHGHL